MIRDGRLAEDREACLAHLRALAGNNTETT
jgi:hypothetical protein